MEIGQIDTRFYGVLFCDLEFSRFDYFTVSVAELINVETTVKICKRNRNFGGYSLGIIDFLSYKIINLNGEILIISIGKFEVDYTGSWVWKET